MDWFEQLVGFAESTGAAGYLRTRERLAVDGDRLRSLANGKGYGIGRLELASLAALRDRALKGDTVTGPCHIRIVQGEAGALHRLPEHRGAMFQVASQFNLLEMIGPDVSPEDGVTRYATDQTQGPACAIAAGAATIYRNYFAPVGGQVGQSKDLQVDGFAELGAALAQAVGQPAQQLWTMRNGYSPTRPRCGPL